MKRISRSKYHVRDEMAELLYGQRGAVMLPVVALGVWRTGDKHPKLGHKIGLVGSAFCRQDLTGGDAFRQLWYGSAILLPQVKCRKPRAGVLMGGRADQFLCAAFAHPDNWGQEIFRREAGDPR